jgi:hypothetical protein
MTLTINNLEKIAQILKDDDKVPCSLLPTLKSQGKDTTALEQQIDNMVYRLYELTYEEVKIIDPENTLTEK